MADASAAMLALERSMTEHRNHVGAPQLPRSVAATRSLRDDVRL